MTYSKDKIVSFIIVLLHLVGALGSAYPTTRELTINLTPFNLLITAGLLITTHSGPIRKLVLFVFISSILGFGVEVMGVSTDFPFGQYQYGVTLGPKLWNVPLLIGINWFILTYSFGMLTSRLKVHLLLKSIIGAAGMVILDVLIEPIAIRFDYWSWSAKEIPLTNYFGWLGASFILLSLYHLIINDSFNKQSTITISSQTFYFSFLQIFFKI